MPWLRMTADTRPPTPTCAAGSDRVDAQVAQGEQSAQTAGHAACICHTARCAACMPQFAVHPPTSCAEQCLAPLCQSQHILWPALICRSRGHHVTRRGVCRPTQCNHAPHLALQRVPCGGHAGLGAPRAIVDPSKLGQLRREGGEAQTDIHSASQAGVEEGGGSLPLGGCKANGRGGMGRWVGPLRNTRLSCAMWRLQVCHPGRLMDVPHPASTNPQVCPPSAHPW